MESRELFCLYIFHQKSKASMTPSKVENYSDDEQDAMVPILLCQKMRLQNIKKRITKGSTNKNQVSIEAAIKKIAKSVARETERSSFSNVPISE